MATSNMDKEASTSLTLEPIADEHDGSTSLWEVVRIAFDSLTANKMRSLLTMLGVIIGVTTVIALLSLGDGLNQFLTRQFEAQGTNMLIVQPSVPKGVARDAAVRPALTQSDVDAIASLNLPLDGLAPQLSFSARITAPAADSDAFIVASTPDLYSQSNMKIASGTFYDQEQMRTAAPVVVLGATLKTTLFGDGDAIGQTVRVKGEALRVIGVLKLQGGLNNEIDNAGSVPLTLAEQRLGTPRTPDGRLTVGVITLTAKNRADLPVIQRRIEVLLREQHHLKADGSADDFSVLDLATVIQQAQTILGVMTLFLGSVAGISLVVGGIGIMNIMLVSVTERTKEIGLRKAVGARSSDILFQFIVEATVISLVGGLIGLVLGCGIAFAVTASGLLFDAAVTPGAVLLALSFSTAVGLFFGIYPAQRAARLNPIDALRFE